MKEKNTPYNTFPYFSVQRSWALQILDNMMKKKQKKQKQTKKVCTELS